MEQELIVRDLTPQDDIRTVARLIYETDEYIYPYMFSSRPEEAECVLGQMIAADTAYPWSHIKTAAVGGRIAAMGTHAELLQTCDIYKEIYESQTKGGDGDE